MSQSFEASWWEILLESFAAFRYDEVNFLIQINSSFIFVSGMKNYESPEHSRKEFICKNVYLKKEKNKTGWCIGMETDLSKWIIANMKLVV